MTARERAQEEVLRFGLSKNAEIIPYIERAVVAAQEAERQACIQIAREVEEQSAQLMGEVQHDATKEYYRGRGLGAAAIAEKIRQQGNS